MICDETYSIYCDKDKPTPIFVTLLMSQPAYTVVAPIVDKLKQDGRIPDTPDKPVRIIIDQLLPMGNREQRFVQYVCEDGQVRREGTINLSKNDKRRAITCRLLKQRFDELEARGVGILAIGALTSVQIRMIRKGIVI